MLRSLGHGNSLQPPAFAASCTRSAHSTALRPGGLHLRSIAFAFPCTTLHSQVAASRSSLQAPHTRPEGLRYRCSASLAQRACSGKEAPEDYSYINALGSRTTRCILICLASLAGVSELALGVAYLDLRRQVRRFGECTGSSADLEYQRAVVNAIQSFSATVVDNKVP